MPSNLCATCAHLTGFTPMLCGKFRDAAGRARLCQPLRTAQGDCGPHGPFWVPAGATGARVIEFPKAGRFA